MGNKIHINDQGELLLIEVPQKPVYYDFSASSAGDSSYEHKLEVYQAALTSAIEKGIKFRDQEAVTKILIDLANEDRNLYAQGSFYIKDHLSQSFDVPNSYTAEVRTDCGCSNLKGPSAECQEAGGKNPYKCVREDLKVAVLTPLKQAEKPISGSEWPKDEGIIQTPFCVTGEPGNEAKKDADLWQTVNPNKPKYAMSTNLTTEGMDVNWIDLWCEIENWYGDHTKRETAEQLLTRLQKKFKITTH